MTPDFEEELLTSMLIQSGKKVKTLDEYHSVTFFEYPKNAKDDSEALYSFRVDPSKFYAVFPRSLRCNKRYLFFAAKQREKL